jgi:hypothetical protein
VSAFLLDRREGRHLDKLIIDDDSRRVTLGSAGALRSAPRLQVVKLLSTSDLFMKTNYDLQSTT